MKREELLKKTFKEKLSQTLSILNGNLLLIDLNGEQNNPHIQMFFLDGIRTRPIAIAIRDNGDVHVIVHEMEVDALTPLEKLLKLEIYKKGGEFYNRIFDIFESGSEVFVETSDKYIKFDKLYPSILKRLEEKLTIKTADDILFHLRSVKTDREISLIRDSITITNNILDELEDDIKAGVSEIEIYKLLSHKVVDTGLKYSFEPIIAGGSRGTNPHPVPYTDYKLESGDYFIIDFGLSNEGYCSDITRSYIIGDDIRNSEFFKYNEILVNALISLPVRGLSQNELGERFKRIANEENFTSFEKHSYGHGLGLAVHDIFPLISTDEVPFSERVIEDNMVFTFEPGFYGDFGGFRIEDDYSVSDGFAVKII